MLSEILHGILPLLCRAAPSTLPMQLRWREIEAHHHHTRRMTRDMRCSAALVGLSAGLHCKTCCMTWVQRHELEACAAVLWLLLLSGECLKWANLDTAQEDGFSVAQLFLTAGLAFLVVLTAIYRWVGLDKAALVRPHRSLHGSHCTLSLSTRMHAAQNTGIAMLTLDGAQAPCTISLPLMR